MMLRVLYLQWRGSHWGMVMSPGGGAGDPRRAAGHWWRVGRQLGGKSLEPAREGDGGKSWGRWAKLLQWISGGEKTNKDSDQTHLGREQRTERAGASPCWTNKLPRLVLKYPTQQWADPSQLWLRLPQRRPDPPVSSPESAAHKQSPTQAQNLGSSLSCFVSLVRKVNWSI